MTKRISDAVAATLHPLEVKVLRALKDVERCNEEQMLALSGLEAAQLRTAIGWLTSKQLVLVSDVSTQDFVLLTPLGERYAREGSIEEQILKLLNSRGEITLSELSTAVISVYAGESVSSEDVQRAVGALKVAACARILAGGVIQAVPGAHSEELQIRENLLRKLLEAGRIELSSLSAAEAQIVETGSKKRGKLNGLFRIEQKTHSRFALTPQGVETSVSAEKFGLTGDEIQEVTPEILASGAWRERGFRRFSLSLDPGRIVAGKYHPYRQYIDFLKSRFIALGFKEMVGSVVETEFWNMDSLFMPQFHSAREIHDVYFLKEPKSALEIPEPFLSNVAEIHRLGAKSGKRGWGYSFDRERTKRLILRSQTTALSSRTLASNPEVPSKYFAIARCFRYDQVDASHAPDFFQVEGIVVDDKATFKTLLGLLRIFAIEIAKAKEIKFVPAYFPFTEPSVEIHMKHPKLGWMELGGAGIFRPEVTEPLGVQSPVLAWGLGVDRMAMVALGVNDIRDLFSRDLDLLRRSRVCGRF